MKRIVLSIAVVIAIAIPWLFLLEALPISYSRISTAAEVTMEGAMFVALLAAVILLGKEMKRMKASGSAAGASSQGSRTVTKSKDMTYRVLFRILYVLASVTLFLIGLVLVLIAVSFSV